MSVRINHKENNMPYLKYLAYELDQFANEETRRLIINLPPAHLKTPLGSVSLAAWMLAHDPTPKVILVTHAEHLSKAIARNILAILEAPWFEQAFETRIKKGHAEVTDFGTTSGGGIFVTSFHGRFIGRRADVILVDDPHDIADEHEQIESTIETFSTVLMSRLNDRKTGRVLVVAHRVYKRDLSTQPMQKRRWKRVVLPLIAPKIRPTKPRSGIGLGARASFCARTYMIWKILRNCARVPSIPTLRCSINRTMTSRPCPRSEPITSSPFSGRCRPGRLC
jgi:hypothetical protein